MEFVILLLVVAVPLVAVIVLRSAQKANEAWQEAARRLGLTYRPSALMKARRSR